MVLISLLLQLSFAKNIILFIGDGMGPSVISSARSHFHKGKTKLNIDQFPGLAIVTTQSKDNHVTDSAAAASAIACGDKFKSRSICYKNSKKRLSEIAKEKGYITGIVTNTTITHATPAAFYASVAHRKQEKEIVKQLLSSDLDFIIGGNTFELTKPLKNQKKFLVYEKLEEVKSFEKPFIGLFSSGHFDFYKKKSSTSKLEDVSIKVLNLLLQQKKPFFLVVEGGRIDHALHKGDIVTAINEMKNFDEIIGLFVKKLEEKNRFKNTSVFVTADHDTTGIDLSGYPKLKDDLIKNGEIQKSKEDSLPVFRYQPNGKYSQNHTGVSVHLYAKGKCQSKVQGTIDNTQIYNILHSCLK